MLLLKAGGDGAAGVILFFERPVTRVAGIHPDLAAFAQELNGHAEPCFYFMFQLGHSQSVCKPNTLFQYTSGVAPLIFVFCARPNPALVRRVYEFNPEKRVGHAEFVLEGPEEL
jgi:hypothetical protein